MANKLLESAPQSSAAPMHEDHRCRLIRILGMLGCVAFALFVCISAAIPMGRGTWSSLWHEGPSFAAIFTLVFQFLIFAVGGLFFWLAWRLWQRWNVSTIRSFTGIGLAAILLWASFLPLHEAPAGSSKFGQMLSSVLDIPLLIAGAIVYRIMSHRLILRAGFEVETDVYGQPLGHRMRIRWFAELLGLSIFFAGGSIDDFWNFSAHPSSKAADIFMACPMILGYIVYKSIVWRSKPRTKPAVPAGGFEVITVVPEPVGCPVPDCIGHCSGGARAACPTAEVPVDRATDERSL